MPEDEGFSLTPAVAATDVNFFATEAGTDLFHYTGRLSVTDFDRMLAWAALRRASDITVQSGQQIWAEIAGKWRRITRQPLTTDEVAECVRAMYGDNGPAIIKTGRDIDIPYEFRHPMRHPTTRVWEENYEAQPTRLRFRVNITGGRSPGGGDGMSCTLRALPSQPVHIDKLEVEPEIMKYWRPEQGLNFVCGPTGSGKSTLLSSLVRWRCEQKDANEKVVEFSSPIEFVYDDLDFPDSFVWQTGAGTHLINPDERGEGGVWNYCIRNSLRRKPTTIILGEARDRHTIEGCIQASLSGHLTISTIHTIGVPETFRRLVMPFPAGERATISVDLLQVLNIIVTQLLLPRLGGGKQAVREYLVFDGNVRVALEDQEANEWPRLLRKMLRIGKTDQGHPVIGQSMAVAARELVIRGRISEEAARYVIQRTAIEEKGT